MNQTAFSYTSTRSIFTLDVDGKIGMNVTFLSPVTPEHILRQSLPVAYMEVSVYAIDGAEHDVQLYSDVSAGKMSTSRLERSASDQQCRVDLWRSHSIRAVELWRENRQQ